MILCGLIHFSFFSYYALQYKHFQTKQASGDTMGKKIVIIIGHIAMTRVLMICQGEEIFKSFNFPILLAH